MDEAVYRGQAGYTPLTLRFYDFWVHGVSNHLAWRCPTRELIAWNNRHISGNHLDVGVGSGFLLDRARFPVQSPRLALMDLNEASLRHTARRVARYQPETLRRNVLEPIEYSGEPFDSIGINYLLHCLPGAMEEKAVALDHLSALLHPEGVLYGSTIVREAGRRNPLAAGLFRLYNHKGLFSNREDRREVLEEELSRRFATVDLHQKGVVVLFAARGPVR